MLTIVLVAAGRGEFTPRFLDQCAKVPVKLVLDESPERLPVRDWLARIRDAVGRVTTPYVMLADNDDLPMPAVADCVGFLDCNPDYVCASGRLVGFHMWPDPVTGPHSAVLEQYTPFDAPADYGQDTANERVLAGFANSWSYYGVYRTEVLLQIRNEVCDLGLTDLQVHEKFCAMRTLTLGKARCFSSFVSLYRQHGTSAGAVGYRRNEEVRLSDMNRVMTMMRDAGVDGDELYRRWMKWYTARDRYLAGKWRKRLKAVFPGLAFVVQNRHRYLPHKELDVQG